jgi:predicted heme/steroid binding protein
MYYFNNEFLKQYLQQNGKLKVFVNGVFYSIADENDLKDTKHGTGYDENGKPFTFDYRDIELIKFGSNISFSLDDLQKKLNADAPEETPEETPTADKEPDASGTDDEENKKAPKEAFLNVGELIVDYYHGGVLGYVTSVKENFLTYRANMYNKAGDIKPGDTVRTKISDIRKLL